jgi:uncharacterized membrane protein YfhO
MDVTLDRPGYLVLADTYYPGWRVAVNGEEQPILRANHAFRAVALPEGESHVAFRYDPLSFRFGLWISGAVWLGAVIAWCALRLRGFRSGP